MKRILTALAATLPFAAHAADAITGDVQRQPTNWQAIVMFLIFVLLTLYITYWASKRVRSRNDYYTAGGNITGFQNGLAIAGDFMSAASFLGISALVYTSGYDGLIYSLGFLVGWPIILFLIAERLRNLGRYTFADVASYRLKQGPIRTLSACGSLVVVALYLIAQMVGAGKLIELLFGLNYHIAVVLVGVLMVMYVLFGGMLATTWVQIIKAVLLLSGASFMALMVMKHVDFNFARLFSEAIAVHPKGEAIMSPGGLVKDPISAISLGLALMFGTAGLPHILMRFFTVSDAKEARKSVFYATGFIGYFYILTFIIGFGAIVLVSTNPQFLDAAGGLALRNPSGQAPAMALAAISRVRGDADALQTLFGNLVDNALKYTPRGGHVDVRLVAAMPSPVVEIEDTGPGIAPAERERVFDRFFRGGAASADGAEAGAGHPAPPSGASTPDEANAPRAQGSGLGLAIVRNIAGGGNRLPPTK